MDNVQLGLELVGVDSASAPIDQVSDSLNEFKNAADEAGEASKRSAETSTFSWTEFHSAYSTVLQAVDAGKRIWEETAGVTVELANNVRNMSYVTGQSAEESSRLIQVLDDYKVSVGDAEKATKKLAGEGLQFNIETLAKLSDEYLSLNTDVERTNFLYEKFGKSGDQFVEVMLQGGDAIREANDAISENLILTDKQLKAARDYEKQLDNTNDALLAFKVSLGNELLPVANDFLQVMQAQIDQGFEWQDAIAPLAIIENIKLFSEALKDNTTASQEADAARWVGLASMYESTTATEGLTEATYDLTTSNEDFLGMVETTSGRIESFESRQAELLEKRKGLEAEKQALIAAGYTEESEKIQDINAKIEENNAKYAENAATFEQENKKIILGYIERKLTADGVLDDKELIWLTEKGVAWGVYHETAVAEVQAMIDEANAAIEGLQDASTFTMTLQTIYETYGDSAMVVGGPRADGGSVSGGMMYPVNERGMPELLTANGKQMLMMPDGMNGNVTPLSPMSGGGSAGMGSPIIVNVMLDSATPDPEKVAYQLAPVVERVLRSKKLI